MQQPVGNSVESGNLPNGETPDAADTPTIAFIPPKHEPDTETLRTFGNYEILDVLGRGGMGVVYKARQASVDREVALKMVSSAADPTMTRRFFREAQITGQLEHPGIVPVYELAHHPGSESPFYVMRLIKGRTLREAACAFHQNRIAELDGSNSFLSLLNAFVTVCNTIAFAHSRGVIHRDLKGQNVVLGDFGEVVVLDWGLAKPILDSDDNTPIVPGNKGRNEFGDPQLTAPGQALGTPAYMAPEQALGHLDQVDHRTDIYGLGAIFYEILTGRPPFQGPDSLEVLRKVCKEEPELPRQIWPDVPADLEAFCLHALAKDPGHRFATATEFAEAVQGWQESQRRRAEQALRESEAFYHTLVESLPQSILRKDLQGQFTYASQGACRILGQPLEKILGRTDYDLVPRDMADKYRADDKHVLETGQVLETMEEFQALNGPKRYTRIIKTPAYDSVGAPIGTQVIFWDVTEIRQLEDELRKTRAELAHARRQLQELADSGPGAEVT